MNYFEWQVITYREYLIKLEAWRVRNEFEMMQTRDICFYSIAPHRDKRSCINKPSDLWPITRREFEGRAPKIVVDVNTPNERKRRKAMKEYFNSINVDFV